MDTRPNDLITNTEARKLLGVSPIKMAELIRNGTLNHWPNPLDKRVKLVSQREVNNLLKLRGKKAA
jgi:hypothetical protein